MEIRIIKGEEKYAPYIGKAIIMAIGEELAKQLAGPNHTVKYVEEMFSRLARRTDSQYSYLNSLVAVTEEGEAAGVTVAYDGARLHDLRRAFFEEASTSLGWNIDIDNLDSINDETGPEEYYLDTVAVFPQFRGKGIGRMLIEATENKAKEAGKPIGLLCSKDNGNARRLYESLGFRQVGERYFAGELMDHLMKK